MLLFFNRGILSLYIILSYHLIYEILLSKMKNGICLILSKNNDNSKND